MKKRDNLYKYYQTLTKQKDDSVNFIIDSTLNKTQSMFHYENLPVTIPVGELEYLLQTNGTAFVTEVDGKLFALRGTPGGDLDAYERPTKYTVANVALNLNKIFDINTDGVLMRNDFLCGGLLPVIGRYAVLLTDVNISLNTCAVLTRLTMLISASDDKTKQSADAFLQKILDGDFSVIAENAFLKGVTLQNINTANTSQITQLIELTQYYKANLLSEIGLNSNFNMKRERLNETEILLNSDELLPFVENMLTQRKQAVQAINEKYGTDIKVDLKSSWKTEHEVNDKANVIQETETATETEEQKQETETEETEETEEQKQETETEETEETEEQKQETETEEQKKEKEDVI